VLKQVCLTVAVGISSAAHANGDPCQLATADGKAVLDTANLPQDAACRFGPYGDNYVLVHRLRNNGWAQNDEPALRGHLSMRYVFVGREQYDLAFSYTGEFDFYWLGENTRISGPVISRINNPALRWRLAPTWIARTTPRDYVEVGVEHLSNGQVIEPTEARATEQANEAYRRRNRFYFDEVSRSADFINLAGRFVEGSMGLPVTVHASARLYWDQDSNITWGPLRDQEVRLSDYHRLRIRLSKDFGLGTAELQWTVGDKGLATDSFEAAWQFRWLSSFAVPLYLRWHHGPLNTLSNYTQRQDSFGIGLRFFAQR
jgi:hypothetical protein